MPVLEPAVGLRPRLRRLRCDGGAVLSASGISCLSLDTLVFTTSSERPTGLSVVGQWVGSNAAGVTFGAGVRCTSGTFERL